MKSTVLIFLMLIAAPSLAQETVVKSAIDEFFTAFHARDTVGLRKVMSEKIVFQSITENEKGASLKEEPVSEFLKSIAGIPPTMKFEEKLTGYDIRIDGTMAHAWTPYVFYLNGKRSHSGVNSFHLYKENGQWKIIYLVDTRRK